MAAVSPPPAVAVPQWVTFQDFREAPYHRLPDWPTVPLYVGRAVGKSTALLPASVAWALQRAVIQAASPNGD